MDAPIAPVHSEPVEETLQKLIAQLAAKEGEAERYRTALSQIMTPRRGLDGHESLQQEADYWAFTVRDYRRIARAALEPQR